MKVLGLDTSTLMTTCAIMEGEILLGEFSLNLDMSHSEALVPMIKEMMDNLKIKMEDIDLIAVSTGPGSFTGLRIGVTTAKSFAHVLNKPIVGVSSLEVLANNIYTKGIIIPMMDARRDRVFTGIYSMDMNELKEILEPDAIEVEELIEYISKSFQEVIVNGDGSIAYKELLIDKLEDVVVFAPGELNLSRGSSVCKLGLKKFIESGSDDFYTMAPNYLRDSQAERNLKR